MSRIRLTITNRTKWRTGDLRRLVESGIRESGVHRNHWRVEVASARQARGCSGRAWLGSGRIRMHVPAPVGVEYDGGPR